MRHCLLRPNECHSASGTMNRQVPLEQMMRKKPVQEKRPEFFLHQIKTPGKYLTTSFVKPEKLFSRGSGVQPAGQPKTLFFNFSSINPSKCGVFSQSSCPCDS